MVDGILGGVVVTGTTVLEVDGSRVHFIIINIPLKIIVKLRCSIFTYHSPTPMLPNKAQPLQLPPSHSRPINTDTHNKYTHH